MIFISDIDLVPVCVHAVFVGSGCFLHYPIFWRDFRSLEIFDLKDFKNFPVKLSKTAAFGFIY